MLTKEECILKYNECKSMNNGKVPKYKQYLTFVGIHPRQLQALFGPTPYTKLQEVAGDTPNKLQMERTPLDSIMKQYGELVSELGFSPTYGEWSHRGLKPTESGIRAVHGIKWSEMPMKFQEWAESNRISGFEKALAIIGKLKPALATITYKQDSDFLDLIGDIRSWIPARRRNSEGEYKVELRAYLQSKKYELEEEFGESNFDLLVGKQYAIEIKKDPNQSEYDRLFGQTARHLQHQLKVIVLILDASRKDKLDNFVSLIDKYLNLDENTVEVIGR